jgi:hypothetical protein
MQDAYVRDEDEARPLFHLGHIPGYADWQRERDGKGKGGKGKGAKGKGKGGMDDFFGGGKGSMGKGR